MFWLFPLFRLLKSEVGCVCVCLSWLGYVLSLMILGCDFLVRLIMGISREFVFWWFLAEIRVVLKVIIPCFNWGKEMIPCWPIACDVLVEWALKSSLDRFPCFGHVLIMWCFTWLLWFVVFGVFLVGPVVPHDPIEMIVGFWGFVLLGFSWCCFGWSWVFVLVNCMSYCQFRLALKLGSPILIYFLSFGRMVFWVCDWVQSVIVTPCFYKKRNWIFFSIFMWHYNIIRVINW